LNLLQSGILRGEKKGGNKYRGVFPCVIKCFWSFGSNKGGEGKKKITKKARNLKSELEKTEPCIWIQVLEEPKVAKRTEDPGEGASCKIQELGSPALRFETRGGERKSEKGPESRKTDGGHC